MTQYQSLVPSCTGSFPVPSHTLTSSYLDKLTISEVTLCITRLHYRQKSK